MTELKNCPFCGGVPELLRIGNDYTKTREVTIKCPECRVRRTDKALLQSMDWLVKSATDGWNKQLSPTDCVDCRTCKFYGADCCLHVAQCVNADRYEQIIPVQFFSTMVGG